MITEPFCPADQAPDSAAIAPVNVARTRLEAVLSHMIALRVIEANTLEELLLTRNGLSNIYLRREADDRSGSKRLFRRLG